jgi:hypothetical protein
LKYSALRATLRATDVAVNASQRRRDLLAGLMPSEMKRARFAQEGERRSHGNPARLSVVAG